MSFRSPDTQTHTYTQRDGDRHKNGEFMYAVTSLHSQLRFLSPFFFLLSLDTYGDVVSLNVPPAVCAMHRWFAPFLLRLKSAFCKFIRLNACCIHIFIVVSMISSYILYMSFTWQIQTTKLLLKNAKRKCCHNSWAQHNKRSTSHRYLKKST